MKNNTWICFFKHFPLFCTWKNVMVPNSPQGGSAELLGKERDLQLPLLLKCPFVPSPVMSFLSLTQIT